MAFYNAFFAFSIVVKFYVLSIFFSLDISKMLCNYLLLKFQNFWELANHPHAEKFKNAMRVKLAGLRSKNI